jgi:predicted  nucleic acid-binding Zn-ribbon protein
VNAEPQVQLRLLDLQALDTALDRLVARRRSLPEHEEIRTLAAQLSGLSADLVTARTEGRDLGRAQAKLEGEVDAVRSRSTRDQSRLDSGAISSSRELENLQSEIASLSRRQGDLEDQLLELMESAETAQAAVDRLEGEQAEAAAARDAAEARRDAAISAIDAETETKTRERAALAAELPADLLALYEKIRASSSGVGAAALVRRRCEGCHLEVGGAELREIAAIPADRVIRHEDCRRILVRTEDSGLPADPGASADAGLPA